MDDISLVKAAAAAEEGAAMNGSAAPDAATAAAAADAAAAAPGAAVPQRRRRWGCGCFSIGAAGSGDDSGTYDEAEAFRTLGAVMLAERAAALAAAAASPGRAARAKAFAIAAVRKLSSYTSFLPMVLIAALPDLRVAALAAACAAAGNFLLSVELRALGVYRVREKDGAGGRVVTRRRRRRRGSDEGGESAAPCWPLLCASPQAAKPQHLFPPCRRHCYHTYTTTTTGLAQGV